MNLDLIKGVDLAGFLGRHYGIRINGSGAGLCPFHEDQQPSLSVQQKNGVGVFHCHGCGAAGSILDFVMKKEGLDLPSAARRIAELESIAMEHGPEPKPKLEVVRVHNYTDEQGRELWQKVKLSDGSFRCRRSAGDKWIYNLEGVRRVPYRFHEIKDERGVIITEGERDADSLAALGYPSTSGPSGKGSWPDELTPIFKDKECRIIYDVGQDEAARTVARKLSTVTPHVFILRVPMNKHEADITDYLGQFATEDEKRDAFFEILAAEQRFVEPEQENQDSLSLILSEVVPREVPWLWLGFIPRGRATLISGDPGSAKTFFCLDLASRLSRGLPWPDGSPGSGPARTFYLTVEDDLADTIRPRVDSLGGDPAMIAAYNSEHPLHLDLSKPDGIQRLETELVRLGNVRLVVVDPIIDFSGGVNPNAGEEVRALLTPLIRLASKLNFALVLVGHLNKAQTLSAIYRAGGTTSGWLGKCRASFMIFRDVDDKALRHVIPIKTNLAHPDPPQLEFRLLDGQLHVEVSREDVDPDEQLNPQHGPRPTERDEAVRWLQRFFVGQDEIPSREVEEAAALDGISKRTLDRAKQKAGFRSSKRHESGGKVLWVWSRMPQCL